MDPRDGDALFGKKEAKTGLVNIRGRRNGWRHVFFLTCNFVTAFGKTSISLFGPLPLWQEVFFLVINMHLRLWPLSRGLRITIGDSKEYLRVTQSIACLPAFPEVAAFPVDPVGWP